MLHSGILKIKSVYSSKWHKKFKCTQARVMQNEVCVRSVKDPEDGSHWRINNWSESKNNLKSYCYNIVKECDQSTFEKQLLLRTIDLNTILVMMTQLYTVNKMLLIIIIINDGSLRDKTCFFFHENTQHNQNQEHNRFVYRDIAASCVPEMTILGYRFFLRTSMWIKL